MKEIIDKYKKQLQDAWKQLKTPGERRKQIPNILTATRLLSPFVIIPSVAIGSFIVAGISTLLFATTDMVDGLLARKMNTTSDLGKDLDAVTDKVFVGTLMISILITNPMYIVPFILEGTIAGINIYKKIKNENPESHMTGKIKMTSLYVLIALGFINMYVPVPSLLVNLLYVNTIGLQTVTIYDYVKNSNEKLDNNKEETKIIASEISEEDTKLKEKTLTENHLEKYRNYKILLQEQIKLEEQKSLVKQQLKKDREKVLKLKIQNSDKK